jgi:hypothetical protein
MLIGTSSCVAMYTLILETAGLPDSRLTFDKMKNRCETCKCRRKFLADFVH